MFKRGTLIERTIAKLAKLGGYHAIKAYKYKKLADKYKKLSEQHQRASAGYCEAASTMILDMVVTSVALEIQEAMEGATPERLKKLGEEIKRAETRNTWAKVA